MYVCVSMYSMNVCVGVGLKQDVIISYQIAAN